MRVLHIISGLNSGGAERMLLKLLHEFRGRKFESMVVSLSGAGQLGSAIEAMGVSVVALDFRSVFRLPRQFVCLLRIIRQFQPDLVQTWMYHADLIGGLAARLAGVRNIFWNIRQSSIDRRFLHWRNYCLIRLCAIFAATVPRVCLINSREAIKSHVQAGYPSNAFRYVPNGFETERFAPSIKARSSVREELGVSAEALIVGLIARYDPQKDHAAFVNAMACCLEKYPSMHVLLAGSGADEENFFLVSSIARTGYPHNFHLLGLREDIPRLTASLDIACSASRYGEGFPNALGEAMASGVTCVVTDVGDCVDILGGSGLVVPPGSSDDFAQAVLKAISLGASGRFALGALARQRVLDRYSMKAVAEQYEAIYREFVS
jgi:glycosyltransferase involved in cell wall biosynthesis